MKKHSSMFGHCGQNFSKLGYFYLVILTQDIFLILSITFRKISDVFPLYVCVCFQSSPLHFLWFESVKKSPFLSLTKEKSFTGRFKSNRSSERGEKNPSHPDLICHLANNSRVQEEANQEVGNTISFQVKAKDFLLFLKFGRKLLRMFCRSICGQIYE